MSHWLTEKIPATPVTPKTAIIIPARLDSTRLPRKVLLNSTGKPLIQHTYEAAYKAACRVPGIDLVAVATGDAEIANVVAGFGGSVITTPRDCPSGTARAAIAANSLAREFTVIINLQADEPEIAVDDIQLLAQPKHAVATLATPITDRTTFDDPNTVKVVVNAFGLAMYFSRSPIPYRASAGSLQHIGVYAFKRFILPSVAYLRPTPLAQQEGLEQLQWLENGIDIAVKTVTSTIHSINTPDDYMRFVERQNLS